MAEGRLDMGKTLVVAEKASVGRQLASYLGCTGKRDGYMEGPRHVVSWCAGHLVELAPPSDYPQWSEKGKVSVGPGDLPMLPPSDGWKWRKSSIPAFARQLSVLEGLFARADIDLVVNACDPDREGEGIFRRVAMWCRNSKPVKRLWASTLEDSALDRAFADMPPAGRYDGLGDAAEARAKADWLIGMNGSFAFHCSVGRVRTPTLALVVARDREVESFVPNPFHQVVLDLGGGFVVAGERLPDPSEAASRAAAAEGAMAEVVSLERRTARGRAPHLPSTTDMQVLCSKLLGLSPSATASVLQSLYEKKLSTYPRTSSQYVTADDEAALRSVVANVMSFPQFASVFAPGFPYSPDTSRCVDDARVEGHTALLPTGTLDSAKLASLSGDESRVLSVLCLSSVMACMPQWVHDVADAQVECNGEMYSAHGDITVEAGWRSVYSAMVRMFGKPKSRAEGGSDVPGNATSIPDGAAAGMRSPVVSSRVHDGKTSPPKRYTYATLLKAMENAARLVDDADMKAALSGSDVHAGGLGTDATRERIIAALEKRGYMSKSKGVLKSTREGRAVVDAVSPQVRSPELTARLEMALHDVERSGSGKSGCISMAEAFCASLVADAAESGGFRRESAYDAVGECPLCGEVVIDRGPKAKKYSCSTNRWEKGPDGSWSLASGCGFEVWKRKNGRKITKREIQTMLSGGTTRKVKFKKRDGGEYEARMYLDDDLEVQLDFS